jgi:hypothetical protein
MALPLGQITIPAGFDSLDKSQTEELIFEVVNLESQYDAVL